MNKITNFLCLSLLLLGATVLGMNNPEIQLVAAAQSGDLEKVERLIELGVSVEAKEPCGSTPLILAANNGHEGVCRLLIENKASVEAKAMYGWTPLHGAANNGREAACRLLIENKASVEAKDNDGLTPLIIAAKWGQEDVCKLLIDVQVNKPAIVTFLGIVRKKGKNLPCHMHYDVSKIIACQVLQLAKWPVIEQIKEIKNPEKRAKWLAYVDQQLNSPIK